MSQFCVASALKTIKLTVVSITRSHLGVRTCTGFGSSFDAKTAPNAPNVIITHRTPRHKKLFTARFASLFRDTQKVYHYFQTKKKKKCPELSHRNLRQIGHTPMGQRCRFVFVDAQNIGNGKNVHWVDFGRRRRIQYGYAFEAFQCSQCRSRRCLHLAYHHFGIVNVFPGIVHVFQGHCIVCTDNNNNLIVTIVSDVYLSDASCLKKERNNGIRM